MEIQPIEAPKRGRGRPKGRLNDKTLLKQRLEQRRKERELKEAGMSDVFKAFYQNPLLWGYWYCSEHFRSKSPPFHLKILLEALKNRFFAVASPRESAKSTILAFLYPIHCIFFKKKRFIIIVSNTYAKAAGSLENIKKELKDNHKLKRDCPIVITKDAEGDSIFRHPDGFEIRVLCKGADQIGSLRGEIFGAYRPDLIIIDDVEDDELVKNPERRQDLKNVIDEALIPAADKKTGQILVIGTILHDDSQMAKFVSKNYYPEFRKLLFRARFDNKSLWEEKWTLEELNKLEKEKPGVFAKEYQNDPAAGPMARFKKDDFRYWSMENNIYLLYGPNNEIIGKGSLFDCKGAIACDLAWEEKRENDFSVVLPAFLTPQSEILINDYICKKGLREDEMWQILTSMEERMRKLTGTSVPIGFEKAKLEKVMTHLLKKEMREQNRYLWFKELLWDGDKIMRVETRLQPRYAQHVIFHKFGMGDLEQQLVRFPSGTHDDLPDALQGIVQLLEYPKQPKKEVMGESEFDWWRKQAIGMQKPNKEKFIFGKKNKSFQIHSKISFR